MRYLLVCFSFFSCVAAFAAQQLVCKLDENEEPVILALDSEPKKFQKVNETRHYGWKKTVKITPLSNWDLATNIRTQTGTYDLVLETEPYDVHTEDYSSSASTSFVARTGETVKLGLRTPILRTFATLDCIVSEVESPTLSEQKK